MSEEHLYDLLPAFYRLRDSEIGEPLRALCAVMERELFAMEDDIQGLYENWFIETCQEWVVPYIGDLLGVKGLYSLEGAGYSQRAYVGNTIAYRRRKGTSLVLEQLARDVTGWPSRAVEFFALLAAAPSVRLGVTRPLTPDLHNPIEEGPFDTSAHTPQMSGRYRISSLGLYLWEVESYWVSMAKPRLHRAGCYRFSPLGDDIPLFNRPRTEMEMMHQAGRENVPRPLGRLELYREIEARRAALADGVAPSSQLFGHMPAFKVALGADRVEVPPEEIEICNLHDWDLAGWAPPRRRTYTRRAGASVEPYMPKVAVDPMLGRLLLFEEEDEVWVSYAYGFSGDVGAGPYDRQGAVEERLNERPLTWSIEVDGKAVSLDDAILAWNDHLDERPTASGLIAISESCSIDLTVSPQISSGSRLAIVACLNRQGLFDARGLRPHLSGTMRTKVDGGELLLDGLLIEGDLIMEAGLSHGTGGLEGLSISHSTLSGKICLGNPDPDLAIDISRSILGPIDLVAGDLIASAGKLSIEESIVCANGGRAIDASGFDLDIQKSTIVGEVVGRSLSAESSIFTGNVDIERQQVGGVRFSFLPEGSRTPQRYRCRLGAADMSSKELARIWPAFVSLDRSHPLFGSLSSTCPEEIAKGGEDGLEMGAFALQKRPLREANLSSSMEEYLRLGMEASIFHADEFIRRY
ncbi:MAG: hypothetical protein JW986_05730 [Methanotrichaceae archaeon]|nr:hypothetical protein [Methanotrichaceae archaeon]